MRGAALVRSVMLVTGAGMVFQLLACSSTDVFEFLQTVLLGVTAAGSVVLIREL